MINIKVDPIKRSVYPTAIFRRHTELCEMVSWEISEKIKRDFPHRTFLMIKNELWQHTRNWRPV